MTERERLIMELLLRGDTVIFVVDEAPQLPEWQDGPYTAGEEFALYREMVGEPLAGWAGRSRAEYVSAEWCAWPAYTHSGGPPVPCSLRRGHEGECEP